MELLLELVANLYDSIIGVVFVLKFNKGNYRENRFTTPAILLCFIISTVFLFISDFSLLHTILITAILFAFSFTVKQRSFLTAMMGPIIFELVLMLSSTLLILSISIAFNTNVDELASGLTIERFLMLFLSKVILTFITTFLLKFFRPDGLFKPIDIILYLISPLATVISLYTVSLISWTMNVERYYHLIIVTVISLVATTVLTLLFFSKYSKTEKEKNDIQIILRVSQEEEKRYEETVKIYNTIRVMKHDLKEQLAYAKTMFSQGNYAEAEEHLNKIEKSISETQNIVYTGNNTIDSIIYSKISANPDVKFIISGVINNLEHIEKTTIISLLGNMLDNAIEETQNHDIKLIELAFSVVGNYQNITCKNPSNNALLNNPELHTTKKDSAAHGLGIKSMRNAVSGCDGMIEFYEQDGYFYCHVAIPLSFTNQSK